ncbi:MAG TPA: hypothetical protein GX696_03410 [Pseudomonadaceae bacterium]|nr:hypothetical protein [Pseudomonadaceae bacterium]
MSDLSLQKQKLQEMEETRSTHIERLNEQLSALGRPVNAAAALEEVLLECETLEEQLESSRRAREALAKEVKDREAAVASLAEEYRLASEELDQWQLQWAEQMQSLGLQGDTPPARLGDFVESVRSLFSTLDDAEKLQQHIREIDQDTAAFDTETAAIVAAIAPELAGSPADEAVLRLHTLLSDNRIRQTKWQQLTEQVEETKREIDESRVDMEATKANLKALCTEANCDHHSQMEALERRSSDHLRIKTAVDAVEHEILEAGEGASLADLEAQAQAIDADGLPGRITELHNSIEEELEPKRTQLAEAKGRETKELELMDGSDQAALLADQAQSILAGIRTDAERYMHAKLGARILRDEIERYRQENQGPLVKRASEYFSTLTLGSFDRLATDFNDKDEPVLAGIRPGEQRVYVEGMSSGTRDQLYLALRLASLEKYMESSEPMPFIVDDILVDFDDARSQAALQVLAELAERMQIILFTHHLRLVEQAQQLRGAVTLQEL